MAKLVRTINVLGAAALATVATAAPVLGQGFDIRSLFNRAPAPAASGTVTQPPPPSAASPSAMPEWSGESGSSGHPLMTADAIRAAAANFGGCLASLWPLAERRGVTRAAFDDNVAGLTPDLR